VGFFSVWDEWRRKYDCGLRSDCAPPTLPPPRETTLRLSIWFESFPDHRFSKSIVPQELSQITSAALEPLLPGQVFFQIQLLGQGLGGDFAQDHHLAVPLGKDVKKHKVP
jgi:hypothetical protein